MNGVFKRMIFILNRLIDLSCVTLTPMDCLSVHYFISSYIKAGAIEQMDLRLSDCNFDDQSLGMLLGIFEPKLISNQPLVHCVCYSLLKRLK